ncbi:MAG: 1A family penicillin-binding protein [Parcubacteria group bacterium Gr01-1014_29]|nr:MAG: 1A family penicillin-binding protein [Parcubacteria group bacterium Gr01-1014_29]
MRKLYAGQISAITRDRNGLEITIHPNIKGHYMRPADPPAGGVPEEFINLLVKKEDRFFYYHLGINPLSIMRSIVRYPFTRRFGGSSTLTQQLVKTLLGNENERTLGNKIVESLYTVSLELHASKKEILAMYADTAYLGSQTQGIVEASKTYFSIPPEALTTAETLQLLATLNSPSDYPGTPRNKRKAIALAQQLEISIEETDVGMEVRPQDDGPYQRKNVSMFELSAWAEKCVSPCSLTIDQELTDTIRKILRTNLDSPSFASVDNGAVVVIGINKDSGENDLLAIIGSPHPKSSTHGRQINMAVRPRAIGSTAKPFIYAKAFEKGARPYTQVEDTEYKYDIGTGFAFYPKNYDGKYRGTVTLHEALSNSLNVPAVRTLEYVGLDTFYKFLIDDLRFEPLQPLETYQLSIALGGLEMDLLTLTNYFGLFPTQGTLKPLRASTNDIAELPMADPYGTHAVIDKKFAQLTTKILSDRETSINQFGLRSNLNLPANNYAVKTGTSYDYHDSWTIGYTPDFIVGVWLGNSDNKPMQRVSGSVGAGKIWHEVMETILNSPYNKKTPFDFSEVKEYTDSGSIEYGLVGDNYQVARGLMDLKNLMLQPHNYDTLEFTEGMSVPLVANKPSTWYVEDAYVGEGTSATWRPAGPGDYIVSARAENGETQEARVIIKNEE